MYQILLLSPSFSAWQFTRLVLEGINLRISIITKSLCNFTLFPMSSKYQVSPWMTSFWHQNEFQERQHIILLQLLYYYSKMTEFEGEIFTISMVLSSTYHIHIGSWKSNFVPFQKSIWRILSNTLESVCKQCFELRKSFFQYSKEFHTTCLIKIDWFLKIFFNVMFKLIQHSRKS